MRITRNNEYIEYFLNGGREQEYCNNLYIKGDKLFNYNTVIAQVVENNYLYVNMTKYSTSTSTIQNYLLDEAGYYYYSIITVNDIQIDTQDLLED